MKARDAAVAPTHLMNCNGTDGEVIASADAKTVVDPQKAIPGPSISVVIPALNEARNLPYVFERMPAGVHEVILVDGHSIDGTATIARQLWPQVRIVNQTRCGKGNALACGFAAATGDVIAMVDADGSADPREIAEFVRALHDGADFAKGSRFLKGGGSSDITGLRTVGNRMLTAFFNLCYRRRYSDLCYGYNVFWRRHLPVLGLDVSSPKPDKDGRCIWGDGFEIETLIHVRAAKAKLAVVEVPSFEYARIHGVSNLNALSDGLRVLRTIVTELYRGKKTSPSARNRVSKAYAGNAMSHSTVSDHDLSEAGAPKQ